MTTNRSILHQILQATGIPQHLIANEVECLVRRAGLSDKDLSLEDIRSLLVDYLQETLVDAKKKYSPSE